MEITPKDSPPLSTVEIHSDHADSPKRKRPRLNDDVPVGLELAERIALTKSPTPGSLSIIPTAADPDDRIDPAVSARATSQSDIPSENMLSNNTAPDEEGRTPETARGTSSPEEIADTDSGSPTIAYIDDDSDGTIEGEGVGFHLTPAQCLANVVQQFPSIEGDVTPLKALRGATRLVVEDRMEADHYEQISEWAEDWVKAASKVNRSSKRRAVASDIDFWNELATLVVKLIQKKTIQGLPRKRTAFLTEFFAAYLELVIHLQDVDIEELAISAIPDADPPRLMSEKHLRNICYILQPWERTSIWKAFATAAINEPDSYSYQKLILNELNQNAMLDFMLHVKLIASSSRSWKYSWRCLMYGLQILNSTTTHFSGFQGENAEEADIMEQLVRQSISITQVVEQALLHDVSKTTAGLPVDSCATIALDASRLLSNLQVLDKATARSFVKVDANFITDHLTMEDLATLAAEGTALQLQWQLLLKGRMDLRIVSVKNMADILIQLFERYRTTPDQQPVLLAISKWLVDHDVIDRLVGPESHPEILMRSDKILGFLIATMQWTPEITDCFWNRVVTMQDQRLAAAALTALWQNVQFMDANLLAQFCEKITTVPMADFTREMISVAEKIFRKLQERHGCSDTAAALCLELLTKSFSPGSVSGIAEELQKAGQNWLRELSRQSLDSEQRKSLYQQCVMEIRESSSRAYGSVLAIWAISSGQRTNDILYVLQELDVLTHLAGLLSTRLDSTLNAREQHRALIVGLTLLGYIIKQVPESNLVPDVAFALWRHLLGDLATDGGLRNMAWDHLRTIMFELGTKHSPLISSILDSFINQLSPEYFTTGVLHFVETAATYVEERGGSSAESEDELHTPALTELIWHLVLDAPTNTIEDASTSLLSKAFVQLHEKVPRTTIGATHAALVEKSLRQLQQAAAALRHASEGPEQMAMDEDTQGQFVTLPEDCPRHDTDRTTGPADSGNLAQHRRHFSRTVGFLARFLADVKQDPALNDQSNEARLPSPRKDLSVDPSSEATVTIKYQAITVDLQGDIKSLNVNVTASFADLIKELKQQTGFDKFITFHTGKILDLNATPEHPASSLSQTGLLIVRSLETTAQSPGTSTSAAVGTSAAERAVSAHLDIIVDFLNLEDELSLPIYHLLHNFPPYGKIRDLVMLGSEGTAQLFPKERLVALYSYNAMNRHLCAHRARGYNDETFLSNGIQVLTDSLVSSRFSDLTLQNVEEGACFLVETLLVFLRERPSSQALSAAVVDPVLTGKRLIEMLWAGHRNPTGLLARTAHLTYSTLLEACVQVRAIWETFVLDSTQAELHHWLLTSPSAESIANTMITLCDNNLFVMALTPGDRELAQYYWSILLPSIGNVAERDVPCKHIFRAAIHIFNKHSVVLASEDTLTQYLATWTTCLSRHVHSEIPGQGFVDEPVLGLVHLITTCIAFLKAFRKQLPAQNLAEILWHKYLFPTGNIDSSGTTSVAQPVLDSETRKQMYVLLTHLCFDHAPTYHAVADMLADVVATEAANPMQEWNANRSEWLRAPAGYSGLKNLTNTCYMNSLMTQLFMNTGFRSFVLSLQPEQKEKYNMVASMQELFGRMQAGYFKFTDTSNFARAVQPYDSEHIDVTIQMDVDEFYNLLFDRLENELPDPNAKEQLRSFWGGQLVTQIKSSDCDHVSERLEPFLAIQCEVKGKATLAESLQAYVEGDHMVGDNKYKCDSCDGRLVNAVKRSCLKDLPDSLIFHLKRFDFDLTTLQRSKINDYFDFPPMIDMTPYTLDQLSNPEIKKEEDMFELAGVLVHTGTAETGHYYSYMRLPYDDLQGRPAWAEFNDTEVTSFDYNRMADSCFGGYWTDAESHLQFPRSWNAYMLFYQRATTAERVRRASTATSSSVGVRPEIPASITTSIIDENEMLIRRYCLYDPVHAHFTKGFVSALKNFDSGVCSGDHRLEEQVYTMAVEYAVNVAARIKGGAEFEALINQILKQVVACGACTSSTLQWIVEPAQQRLMSDMLTCCSQAKPRQAWVVFVYSLLKSLREYDLDAYGIDMDEVALSEPPIANAGVLDRLVDILNDIWPRLAHSFRSWDDYFQLLASVASLGRQEIKILLSLGIWRGCLDLFNVEGDRYLPSQKRNTDIKVALQRAKFGPSYNMLTKLICQFVINLDVHGVPVDEWSDQIAAYDHERGKYPLAQHEQDYLIAWLHPHKRLLFLAKLITSADHSDANSRSWWPGDVIAALITDAPAAFVEHVIITLQTMLDLYYPNAGGFVLRAAIGFCKACTKVENGNEVINAAAINAGIIHKYVELRRGSIGGLAEPETQGGGPHLEFFSLCGEMTKIACSSDKEAMERPYLLTVIGCASEWAIPILMFDEFAMREKVCDYLDELIFNQYPLAINIADDAAALLDRQRCVAVRALWMEGMRHLKIARGKSVPSAWAKHVLRVMRECVKWADKLLNEEGDEYKDLPEPEDSDMIKQFGHVEKFVEEWGHSDDYDADGGLIDSEEDALSEVTEADDVLLE